MKIFALLLNIAMIVAVSLNLSDAWEVLFANSEDMDVRLVGTYFFLLLVPIVTLCAFLGIGPSRRSRNEDDERK